MYKNIIDFWFNELTPADWWKKNEKLDSQIKTRFENIHNQVRLGEHWQWREHSQGRLAEIIVLDQFSRNMYRDTPQAFLYDPLALVLSQEAVLNNAQKNLTSLEQSFLFMPYMHSESKIIHEQAVELYSAPGLENNLDFEHKHKVIIDQFGRYPHRNKILGRESTPEEQAFLQQPNSSF